MKDREKMLNLPGVISALLCALVVIQGFCAYGPGRLVYAVYDSFSFIPLRFSFRLAPQHVLSALGPDALDLGSGEKVVTMLGGGPLVYVTPLTYAFLHGGWTHLLINGLTLMAFGAPVARRLGAHRFLWFFCGCAVAGALTHLAIHPLDSAPVVGASAAISGTMAAIVRFAFSPGARVGEYGAIGGTEARTAPLSQLGENKQAMLFLVVWFGANFLLGAFPQSAGLSEAVAWEAHIGGFVFGLVTFGAFDRRTRRV